MCVCVCIYVYMYIYLETYAKIRDLQYEKSFIEVTRALSAEIYQATAIGSCVKQRKIRLSKGGLVSFFV